MDSLPPLERLAGGNVGNELAAILHTIAEISVDSGPKFGPAVCRRLARWIVCRAYAGPLRELCHLVRLAERRYGEQGFETLFWDGGAATASGFRRHLGKVSADGIRPTETGVAVCYPDGAFAVAFTRMPFLAALMEFLISVFGYGELDGLFRGAPETTMTRKSVDAMANELARRLYAWLAPHLPSAQAQRKFRAVTAFLQRDGRSAARAHDITDETVLAFWIFAVSDPAVDGDFRSYRTVFHLMVAVREALEAAAAQAAMARACAIGGDRAAGEIDPGAIDASAVDAVLGAMHERTAPLDVLAAPPANAVKFLKRTEADEIGMIVRIGDAALALPLSVLRAQVLGAVQLRISQALRRSDGAALDRLLGGDDAPQDGYGDWTRVLARIHDQLEQLLLASLHNLVRAGHTDAIAVMLYLRPAMDLSPLAFLFEPDEAGDDTVVRLHPAPVGERFLHAIAAEPDRCPALACLLRDAAAAARRITRRGFRPEESLDATSAAAPFAAAAEALIALRQTVARLLDRLDRLHVGAGRQAEQYSRDREIFTAQFRALYGDRR